MSSKSKTEGSGEYSGQEKEQNNQRPENKSTGETKTHKEDQRKETKDSKEQEQTFDEHFDNKQEEISAVPDSSKKIRFIDLRSLQRELSFKEVHVPVARGNYDEVRTKIVNGEPGGFVITGPTGCGKSTVALLPLFTRKGSTVLMIEPTQANAANILHEFQLILPNLVAKKIITGNIPPCSFVAPTVSRKPYTPLAVTTTDKLLEFFVAFDEFPKVDYMVIDEFHLPIPSMVKVVELLRIFNLAPKYIFVSATAKGYSVSPQLPSAVKVVKSRLPLGHLPKNIARTDLDPRKWQRTGDGTVAVVAPSVEIARKLHALYLSWRLRSYLITRYTVVSRYLKATRDYRSETVYVLESGVEASLTLSMSVLVSMGASTAIRYDGKVVIEDTRPLDKIVAIQRGGLGGRVIPTLYVTPEAPEVLDESPTADYYKVQAIICALAYGADISKIKCTELTKTFPKLLTITKELATIAMLSGGDPFVNIYKSSKEGILYKECGGTGEGFDELAKKELFVYYYDEGFYVAPITDFSNLNSKPDSFVLRKYQFSAARLIVEAVPKLTEKFEFDKLVEQLIRSFKNYVNDLFVQLKSVFPATQPSGYRVGNKAAEVEDFFRPLPPLVKLFSFLKTQPCDVKYQRHETKSGDWFLGYHSFSFNERSLHYAVPPKYIIDGTMVDTEKLARDTFEILKGILCIEMLLSGAPEKCVDLNQYKAMVPGEHKWFKENVVDRRSI
ncbi:hypothetical protein GcM1_214009 [Golovinomyces cichoracearum]|uniref:Helicase ATP-binding domain-containing protein n=1 Tax=Golovinomyces cichoracearum TaxID=62708 RepID=A0A420IU20_9PEZI|nr:hypothetical protein GcM1_214009 [Golovinomyces cichoracearum]